jgi:membrane protein
VQQPETDGSNGHGLSDAARQVADHATAIARLEVELARLELKRKAADLGAGIGLGAGAALLVFFGLGFLFAAVAAGLATVMPVWAALLVTAALLVLVAAVLGLLARSSIRRATPPVPEQAIREARLTGEALKR